MKAPFVRALAAALLAVMAVSGTVAGNGHTTPSDDVLLKELGRARTTIDRQTGNLTFVAGTRADPAAPSWRLGSRVGAQAAARAFVERYATLFGVGDTARGLRVARTQAAGETSFVRFEQVQGGVPVIGGELIVQIDAAGNAVSAIGEATGSVAATLSPNLTAAEASAAAKSAVGRDGAGASGLTASLPELAVYDPALLGAPGVPGARLVWRTEVRSADRSVDEYVLVDAATGTVALRFSQVEHALPAGSRVCNAGGDVNRYPCQSGNLGNQGHADVIAASAYMDDFHEFFLNRFGRDSMDAAGMPLIATVNVCDTADCDPYFANAFWDGSQAVFWRGMAVDDVVTHEFAHGFTEFTSGLLYYHQSGAINEALSDIFGELVDISNGSSDDTSGNRWLMGESSVLGPIRDMESPTTLGQPDRMQSALYWASESDHFGVHYNSGVANKAAYLMVDGGAFNGQTISPLGVDKTAALWYRVATQYLWSGSDYADLAAGLQQACTDLIDMTVLDGSGVDTGDPIDAADCTEVGEVVLATEMVLDPTVPGAVAPAAPDCVSGSFAEQFRDTFDSGLGSWAVSNTRFTTSSTYTETPGLALHGRTPNSAGSGAATRSLGTLAADSFLTFRHAYVLDHGPDSYDGGVVEYSVNGGAWTDAQALFTHNGYDGTIARGFGNPLANRAAFVGYSPGFLTSRLDLSNLAGQSVELRFIATSDMSVADYGWFIEEVRLFTCAGATDIGPPLLGAPNATFRTGVAVGGTKPVKLNVAFTASDASGLGTTSLERRTNTKPWMTVALGSPTGTSVDLDYPTGKKKRQFRASATDSLGNASGWLSSPAFKVLAIQNGASAVVQSGSGWKTQSSSSFYGGSVRHNRTAGARQRLTRKMSDVAIVTTLGPNRGKFDVYVDGQYKATIDTYSPTTRYRQVVFAWDFGSVASHTIELRVLGARNAASTGTRVDFDAFLVLAP